MTFQKCENYPNGGIRVEAVVTSKKELEKLSPYNFHVNEFVAIINPVTKKIKELFKIVKE